jgi:transposase
MRKSFDGLCGLVSNHLNKTPSNGEVFIFINRTRNKIKLLHWEHGGFVLYYKRLVQGTFKLPVVNESTNSCQISWSLLVMMVDGISIEKAKHRKRFFINNSPA